MCIWIWCRGEAVADVFISCSSKDRALAEALARDIQTAGWTVWWDPEIRAGSAATI